MIVLLLVAVAMADPPPMCDPKADTADATAAGFCLDEVAYLEIGELRKRVGTLETEVAGKDEEIAGFETWQERQAAILDFTVTSMTDAHTRGIDLVVGTCTADLEACHERSRRTFVERHGFALGLTAGIVTTVALTAVTLEVYGSVLAE